MSADVKIKLLLTDGDYQSSKCVTPNNSPIVHYVLRNYLHELSVSVAIHPLTTLSHRSRFVKQSGSSHKVSSSGSLTCNSSIRDLKLRLHLSVYS